MINFVIYYLYKYLHNTFGYPNILHIILYVEGVVQPNVWIFLYIKFHKMSISVVSYMEQMKYNYEFISYSLLNSEVDYKNLTHIQGVH